MSQNMIDDGRELLLGVSHTDSSGRPVTRIEALAQDRWDRLEGKKPIRKAIETAGYSGTGYQNQDSSDGASMMPQDRMTPLADETQNQQAALAWVLRTKVPIRKVRTLVYDKGRLTERPWNVNRSENFGETGVPLTHNHTYQQAQGAIKLWGAQVSHTFLTKYLALSYGQPSPEVLKMKLINEDHEKFFNADLWASRADCGNLGAVSGAESLRIDGLRKQYQDASATFPHVRIDCGGAKLTIAHVMEGMARLVESGFVPSSGAAMGALDIITNAQGIIGQRQWNYLSADIKSNYGSYYNIKSQERQPGGFTFNGKVITNEGNPMFIRDFYLPQIHHRHETPPAAAQPTGCTVPAPVDVSIANVAVGSGPGVPASEYFTTHGTTGNNYYWVRLKGPSGGSRCIAATGPAFVTSATGNVTAITVNTTGLTLTGDNGAWSAEVWRHTTDTPVEINGVCTTGGYIGEFPIPEGTTNSFTIYDDDYRMPNVECGTIIPLQEHTLQLAQLVPWGILELAMGEPGVGNAVYRRMMWEAADLALYARNRGILFDNVGDD